MKSVRSAAVVGLLALAIGVVTGFLVHRPAGASSNASTQAAAIYRLQAAFHRAASTKDVDLMVSLFAGDASLSTGGQTYTGRDQIRSFFATKAGAFQPQNNWISLTPAFKTRIEIHGRIATLFYECHYVDLATKALKADLFADTQLIRAGDGWRISSLRAGPVELSTS